MTDLGVIVIASVAVIAFALFAVFVQYLVGHLVPCC